MFLMRIIFYMVVAYSYKDMGVKGIEIDDDEMEQIQNLDYNLEYNRLDLPKISVSIYSSVELSNNKSNIGSINKDVINGINDTKNNSKLEKITVQPEIKKNVRKPVKLNMRQGLAMNQVVSVYTLSDIESNYFCKNHSREFAIGLRALEPWALQMFDSSSKLPAGILTGNLHEFGAFQQCIEIYHKTDDLGEIRGKHCSVKIVPNIKLLKKILEYRNITEERFSKVYQFVKNASFVWALCVPHTCKAEDVLEHVRVLIQDLTQGLNLTVFLREQDCVTRTTISLTTSERCVLGCLGGFILIIMIFTIIDLYSNYKQTASNDLVRIFSAYTNGKQIFAKSPLSSDLDCVHGIRFLSTCYVVIGHRYLMMMFFPVINGLKIMDWVLYYRSTAITGGTLCVDTFFMISGMLVSFGFFQEITKTQGRINWGLFYIYRYMRITPPLAIVVLCYATLIHHLGSGPLWQDMLDIIQKPCQEYWWATILHIQNYIHPFPLCMTQAWYLTCDMQYYFLSPIILVPLWKWPIFGYINFIIIYFLSVAINFYLAWINEYDGGVPVTNQLFSTKYFQHHYITPHVRAATYLIGLGFGYLIYHNQDKKPKMNILTIFCGWSIAITIMLASLVGCHSFHESSHKFNRMEASIYLSCSRSGWTFGIVWIIWACINGYGGPINTILSSHFFRVLGRISYSIYLCHMGMQYLISGAHKMPGYFSDFSAVYAAFSDLFIMVVIGFLFTVCFESPLIKSLSLLFKRRTKAKIQPVHGHK